MASAATSAQTLYVDSAAQRGGDGTSWSEAIRDLQDALDTARAKPGVYSEIRIAQGVYTPDRATGDRAAFFEPVPHVALKGGYAGQRTPNPDARDADAHRTVLSGDLLADDSSVIGSRSDNAHRVVAYTGSWGLDEPIVLDGLTITGGNAPDGAEGAAARFELANLSLIDCTITANASVDAGAVRLQYCGPLRIEDVTVASNIGGGLDADGCWEATITSSRFARNTRSEPDRSTTGGGLWLRNTRVTIADCVISENTADRGGGVALVSGDVTFLDSTIAHNNAASRGGGIDAFSGETALLRSRVIGNHATDGAGVNVASGRLDAIASLFWANEATEDGGAIQLRPAIEASHLVNCVLIENRADTAGAIFAQAPALLTHCTLWGNHAADTGGVLDETNESAPLFAGSVVWNNTDDTGDPQGAQFRSERSAPAERSFIQAWDAGGSTSPADPLLRIVTFEGAPLPLLTPQSPAINAGDADDLPFDTFDLDGDAERFEPLPTDYLGAERVIADAPDAGAVETPDAQQSSADLNADGVVGPFDLTQLLSMWGPCPIDGACDGDFDNSGEVNATDLTFLLSAWTSVAPPPN